MAETRLSVKDWPAFFAFAREEGPGWKELGLAEARGRILALAERLAPLQGEKEKADQAIAGLEKPRREADTERLALEKTLKEKGTKLEKAEAEALTRKIQGLQMEITRLDALLTKERQRANQINQEVNKLVNEPGKGEKDSVYDVVKTALRSLQDDAAFFAKGAAMLEKTIDALPPGKKAKLTSERKRLVGLGIAEEKAGDLRFTLRRPDKTPTEYELAQVRRWNGHLLEVLHPGWLRLQVLPHFVDQRLHTPRDWREIHQHDGKGNYLGFTRWDGSGPTFFNREGHLIREKDDLGRCKTAEAVTYEVAGKRFGPPSGLSLRMTPTGRLVHYVFDGNDDMIGTPKTKE
jgi:hypothetical protein